MGWSWGFIEQERSEIVVDHVLFEVHMTAGSVIEEHAIALIESLEADPVFLIHLLLSERHIVTSVIPGSEPFRELRVDSLILVPHPEAKVSERKHTSLVSSIFDLKLIVDLGEELRVRVVAI